MQPITRLIASMLLASTSAHAAAAPAESWKVAQRSGDAHILRSGVQSVVLQANAALLPGDIVVTGPAGRATLTRGADYIVVAPGSRLQVPQAEQISGFTHIVQQAGTLLYKIRHMAVPHFQVETPMLAAVIKGTTFTITVDQERSAIQVIDGAVEVSAISGGMHRLVTNGDTVFVAHSNPSSLVLANAASIEGMAGQSSQSLTVDASETESLLTMATISGGLMRADPVSAQAMQQVSGKPVQLASIGKQVGSINSVNPSVTPVVTSPAAMPGASAPATGISPAGAPAVIPAVVVIPANTPSMPMVSVPAITMPATIDPAVTAPAVTIPAATVPAVTVPAVTVPAVTVPAVTVPAVTVPAITTPVVTVPVVTTPAVTLPTVTLPVITVPISSGSIPSITIPGIVTIAFGTYSAGKITLPKLPKGKSD